MWRGLDSPCQDCLHPLNTVEDFLPSEEIDHGLFKNLRPSGMISYGSQEEGDLFLLFQAGFQT